MLKKILFFAFILSFMSFAVFSVLPKKCENTKTETHFLKNVKALSDQELEILYEQSLASCIGAIAEWTVIILTSETIISNVGIVIYGVIATNAFNEMSKNCGIVLLI